jgi:hypothetical protein
MGHSVIIGVPEIAETARRSTRHPPMVDVASKVRLAGQADGLGIFLAGGLVGGPAVVTIGFVIPRINHISWQVRT